MDVRVLVFGICLKDPKQTMEMKKVVVLIAVLTATGCDSHVAVVENTPTTKTIHLNLPTARVREPASSKPSLPSRLGIPVYPGAVYVEGSEKLRINGTDTLLSRTYRSDEPLEMVAAFYRTEAPKLGRVLSLPTHDEHMTTWSIRAGNGRALTVTATRLKDGTTSLFLQTSTPNRR